MICMNRNHSFIIIVAIFQMFAVSVYGKTVVEPARDIPVAYEVDVVVVGGASAGVAAAVAAAGEGATVFVAAPRPYLGEDLCASYRLWLEAGEMPTHPLAQKLFTRTSRRVIPNSLPFTYTADLPSASKHKDTKNPSILSDGKWFNAPSQSVQYDGDVTITVDLKKLQAVEAVHVMIYQRPDDFEIKAVTVSSSSDQKIWKQAAVIANDRLGLGIEQTAADLSAPIKDTARYIRFAVKKTDKANRVLLGEIVVEGKKAESQPPSAFEPMIVTPMQVKHTLDQALLDAGVKFLFGCYQTNVLRDEKGNLAGIVMANRSGRQAVKAKIIIDATPRAIVARMAGGSFANYPADMQTFTRVVVGGELINAPGVKSRKISATYQTPRGTYDVVEYTLTLPMPDGSFASFAQADQIARDKTWNLNQGDASEMIYQVPPDPMKGRRSISGDWVGVGGLNIDAFRPAGVDRLYVLGGCADITRAAAAKMLQPNEFIQVGDHLGKAAAQQAKSITPGKGIRVADLSPRGQPSVQGQVMELLDNIRPGQKNTEIIPSAMRAIPVLAEYDVVVVGGGTGGAPAGIGAGRKKANTLVVEYLHGLGGVGTLGLISNYYYGNRVGFTAEVNQGLADMKGQQGSSGWEVEKKIEWYRSELRKANVDIWFGCLGAGAVVGQGKVKGVVVATPFGRGVVLAKTVVDSTGNAAIAAAAGAPCTYITEKHIAMQGTGLPPRELGAGYTNTDYTFVDETDTIDTWRAFVLGREKYQKAYDLGQLIDTRERRQIIGDYMISPLDIWNRRTYPDTISIHVSNFDTHGFTIHPVFMIRPPDREKLAAHVPYRALLPKGLDGILVTGLGASAHRDAMPVIRMQACVQNQGYAAGTAAAMIAEADYRTREIDIKALQKHLVEKGNLPESVLTDQDSYPLGKTKIARAVEEVIYDYEGIEVLLADPERAMPLLKSAYQKTEDAKAQLAYAHILGMFGDNTGVEILISEVESREWDKGWNYKGMGQFGASMSELDSYIVALGRTRDPKALKPILKKVDQLSAANEFSHHRAVAIALETLKNPLAAKPIAELLQKPDMTGHAYLDIVTVKETLPRSSTDNTTRTNSLRELVLARALYRCGDFQGLGAKILNQYTQDMRGHYARHAIAILQEK
jgi:flavin-dependent dehydrogenase